MPGWPLRLLLCASTMRSCMAGGSNILILIVGFVSPCHDTLHSIMELATFSCELVLQSTTQLDVAWDWQLL